MILTVAAKQQQTKPGGMKGRHLSKCWEAGQEPPSTPDPTDRCSGENLANLPECQDRHLRAAIAIKTILLTRWLVTLR